VTTEYGRPKRLPHGDRHETRGKAKAEAKRLIDEAKTLHTAQLYSDTLKQVGTAAAEEVERITERGDKWIKTNIRQVYAPKGKYLASVTYAKGDMT